MKCEEKKSYLAISERIQISDCSSGIFCLVFVVVVDPEKNEMKISYVAISVRMYKCSVNRKWISNECENALYNTACSDED